MSSREPTEAVQGSPLRDLCVPSASAAASAHRLVATSEVRVPLAESLAAQASRRGWSVQAFYLGAWLLAQHAWRGADEWVIGAPAQAGVPDPAVAWLVRTFVVPSGTTVGEWLAQADRTLAQPPAHSAAMPDVESCWLQADDSAVDVQLAALAPAAPLTIALASSSPQRTRLMASVPPSLMEAEVEAARAQAMVDSVVWVAEALLAQLDQPLAQIQTLTPDQRQRLLTGWHPPMLPKAPALTVHAMFSQQAQRHGDAIALVCGGERLSYRELDRRSDRIAARLVRRSAWSARST
jgi:non-ribosomal peptide synthetase component F